MFNSGGRPPAHKIAGQELVAKDVVFKTVIDTIPDGVLMPNVKAMAVIFNFASTMINELKTGEITIEESLTKGTKRIKEELQKKQSVYE